MAFHTYKAIRDGEKLELAEFFGECARRSKAIRVLDLTVDLKHLHTSMFQPWSQSIEVLSISVEDNDYYVQYDYSAMSKAIGEMLSLKRLDLTSFTSGDICIKSQSLEALNCSVDLSLNVAECWFPSLKFLSVDVNDMEWSILKNCTHTLQAVSLTVHSCPADVDIINRKLAELSRIVATMARLKEFSLRAEMAADELELSTFNIVSTTLQELHWGAPLGDCKCPALKVLQNSSNSEFGINIHMERLRISSFEVGSIEFLELCYDEEVPGVERGLDHLSTVIDNMKVLKTLHLKARRHYLRDNDIVNNNNIKHSVSLRSKSIECIRIDKIEMKECNCPLLKTLVTSNLPSAVLCSSQLEKLSMNLDREDNIDTGLMFRRIAELVEQMPKLKKLRLDTFADCCEISINSKTLEEIDVTGSGIGIKVVECICPSLQTFYVKYDYYTGKCNNGVQLIASHEVQRGILKQTSEQTQGWSEQDELFCLSKWDFVGMEAPKSCVVKMAVASSRRDNF